ncbi:hypothetical protein CK203_060622 [Vitis vinifera]|uniref:Uncharacterized protein n=1 Tax=Vitis vinifera TaxID=29760 RepID=A0A438GC11_VITVI|nr:hypothetical protein CK203_060622 [Vitis vinifera]
MSFAGITTESRTLLVEVACPSIWQLRGTPGARGINIGAGRDDNFEWRQTIERRQLASERQLKALLQETERLREENAVLRIQASTSGPPRRQRSRGQVANSRPQQEPESIYPGTTGAIPGACNVRPHEPARLCLELPLSNSMRARLGPQEPGRSRPPMATTWAPRPDPMATPMVQNVHPHRDPVVTPVMRNVHSHPADNMGKPPKRATHWLHQQKAG